ncbi:unnamed protein product [Protopolystoma xenopodis]|uniref:Uncharacterized protein n=1 Tax=Protopolystoma xenopodis TaxID=117903 RepID=A0A3S5ANU6_9PLAT|nr:unnamed protein product [Protopolystoma xenopodis]
MCDAVVSIYDNFGISFLSASPAATSVAESIAAVTASTPSAIASSLSSVACALVANWNASVPQQDWRNDFSCGSQDKQGETAADFGNNARANSSKWLSPVGENIYQGTLPFEPQASVKMNRESEQLDSKLSIGYR